jgi:hypothetical protein
VRRIRITAVLISWVVDVVGSNVLALLVLAGLAAAGRISPDALSSSERLSGVVATPEVLWLTTTTGLIVSVIAGYVGARIAGHDEVLHGALASVAGFVVGLLQPEQLAAYPLILSVGSLILAFAASAFGGWIRLRTKGTSSLPMPT